MDWLNKGTNISVICRYIAFGIIIIMIVVVIIGLIVELRR